MLNWLDVDPRDCVFVFVVEGAETTIFLASQLNFTRSSADKPFFAIHSLGLQRGAFHRHDVVSVEGIAVGFWNQLIFSTRSSWTDNRTDQDRQEIWLKLKRVFILAGATSRQQLLVFVDLKFRFQECCDTNIWQHLVRHEQSVSCACNVSTKWWFAGVDSVLLKTCVKNWCCSNGWDEEMKICLSSYFAVKTGNGKHLVNGLFGICERQLLWLPNTRYKQSVPSLLVSCRFAFSNSQTFCLRRKFCCTNKQERSYEDQNTYISAGMSVSGSRQCCSSYWQRLQKVQDIEGWLCCLVHVNTIFCYPERPPMLHSLLAEKKCVAVITTKMWKEDSDFCQILLYDKNLSLEQNFGASNVEANHGIWVNSAAETTPQSAMNCVAPFTETLAGCFLVGVNPMSWDHSDPECPLLGPDAHLAEPDTEQVCHWFVCFNFLPDDLHSLKDEASMQTLCGTYIHLYICHSHLILFQNEIQCWPSRKRKALILLGLEHVIFILGNSKQCFDDLLW